jgi:hypothetical protein
MKTIKLLFVVITLLNIKMGFAQTQLSTNASLNILSANSGLVSVGGILDLNVSVTNTGANPILANRIRVQISIPNAIGLPLPTVSQTTLAASWVVVSNNQTSGVITICNSTDIIPAGQTRTSTVKVTGVTAGGPLTIIGGLAFGTAASCSGFGSLNGDNPADNGSTTGLTVTSVVPLSILDFSGASVNCEPSLKWTTTSETNTNRFEIEKSTTGNDNWKAIATVAASGNSSTNKSYSYVDKDINGAEEKLFYRLKMVDNDGRFSYSRIAPVLSTCKSAKMLVYPNPVENSRLNVSLAGTIGNVQATLIAVTGEVVLTIKLINGINYVNISNVANGMYILNVKDASGFHKNTKLIVKQ